MGLCLVHFPEVYDKFSYGMRKDKKITLLLDYCRRLPIREDKLLGLVRKLPEEETEQTFHLPFANRETEKKLIQTLLKEEFDVQIHAAGGLGKTYILREMQREMIATGRQTIWIDFAGPHSDCIANRHRFLQVFAEQLSGSAHISNLDEEKALKWIGQQVANLDQAVLFLDNADRGDMRLLRWIREVFLERLATEWVPIRVVASAQQIIPEWHGVRHGRSFRELALSEFDDSKVIEEIINDVVAQFGFKHAKARQALQDQAWKSDLDIMVDGLLSISRGHPLAMAEVLRYTAKENGFMRPHILYRQLARTL